MSIFNFGSLGSGNNSSTASPGGSFNPQGLMGLGSPFGGFQNDMQEFAGAPNQMPDGYAYNPSTGMAQQVGGGFYGPTNQTPFNPGQSQGLTGSEQMQAALMGDYGQMVDANMFNYQNTQQAIGNYEDAIMGGAEDIRQSGIDARELMFGLASNTSELGQRQYDERQVQVDEVMAGFEDYSAAMSSSTAAGLATRNRSEAAQNMAGIKMQDPIAMQRQADLEGRAATEAYQTMTGLGAQFNQTRASLGMQGIASMNQAAQTQQGYESLSTNMNTMGVQFAQAAETQAANMEAQGMGNVAQMMASNPFNPISFAQTLSTFFQFTETPGSDEFAGFNEGLLFPGSDMAIT